MNTQKDLAYWLATAYFPMQMSEMFISWLSAFADIEALFKAKEKELSFLGVPSQYIQVLKNPNWSAVEKDLSWAQTKGHHLMTYADANYPPLLKEISHAPLLLYIKGNKNALLQKQIAMVGARKATFQGLKIAGTLAADFVAAGFAVTSGLAAGIDGSAHSAALSAKGITIAVLGTGFNYCYPKQHQGLAEKICENEGALVSEFPLHMPPFAFHFPRRNRIISGLSLGVLVVEAALKSGSLITARYALSQGREVFAVPGSIQQSLSQGCHYLIKEGAKLVESAADVFDELGIHFTIKKINKDSESLSSSKRQVLALMRDEVTPMELILIESGLTQGEVSSILLSLELEGWIEPVQGGYRRI